MSENASAVVVKSEWSEAWERALGRVSETAAMSLDGFPHYGDPETGKWTTTPDAFWTGGFWVGELWLAAHATGDEKFREQAAIWLKRLEPRIESRTVFRGFLFYYGAVTGAILHHDGAAGRFAARAAQSLTEQFDETAGLIPLGSQAEEAHSVGDGEANIDGLPATPLMLWVACHLKNHNMRELALRHARRSGDLFIRPDGGVIQSASFDTKTGEVTRRYTHKGYSDSSIWTRAQGWAMLGYTLSAAIEPEEKWLLERATQVADWWLANVPTDHVAYWDFDAPVTPETKRDSSGTAIAAAALLKLSAIHPDGSKAKRYDERARATVAALVKRHLRSNGILGDGCFDPKNDKAVANELIWGDYFLLECLAKLSGRLAMKF